MSATVRVTEVVDKRSLRTFIMFPWRIYRKDTQYPNWVPPLIVDEKAMFDSRKNPFFEHAKLQNFLAHKNGTVAGRISAIVNHSHNDYYGDLTGFFGFFECTNDLEVAQALFSAAEDWLRNAGMQEAWGPMNPSSNYILGLLLDSYEKPPLVKMPYNPPYYVKLYENSELKKAKDLYAYYMTTANAVSDKMARVGELVRKRGNVVVRPVDMKHLHRDIEYIRTVYNDAWTDNWGFVPWTQAELDQIGEEMKPIADPQLVLLAFIDDDPVAFSLALPDVNQALIRTNGRLLPFGLLKLLWHSRKIDMLRVLAMGVRKSYQNSGIDALLYAETHAYAHQSGLHRGEFSWILEDNYALRNSLEKWGVHRYKTYRIYRKEL